jgi:tRNA threonylcarbamoyladenosine biosynthesis protein TsaE
MQSIQIKINSIEETKKLGFLLTTIANPNDVISLNGDLGAGKTVFTKGVGEALGVKRVINSPTFTIMKIYDITNEIHGINRLYHLDVYRLKDSSTDFELEEYFYFGGITVIEWAKIIDDLLPTNTLFLTFEISGETTRNIEIATNDVEKIATIKELLKGENYEILSR